MVRKLFGSFAVLALVMSMIAVLTASVGATHGSSGAAANFPAQNQNACTAHNGIFEQDGNVRTCTVTVNSTTTTYRAAGNNQQGNTFSTTTTTTGTIEYERIGDDLSTDPNVETSTTCYNPQGNELEDPGNNPNCQPPVS